MGYFNISSRRPQTIGRWSGKKWAALGDSNTENNFRAKKKYVDFASERMSCTIHNYGFSGFGYIDKGNSKAVYQKISSMPADADIITVLAGGNDVAQVHDSTYPLGAINDTDPSTSFYGALNHTMQLLVTKYPTKTVAVISQMRRGEGKDETIKQMVEATREVASKYGLPFLDLYNGGNVHAYNQTYIQSCMPDGVHLNDLGSELISWKVQAFLESL